MGKITTAVFEPGSTTANVYGLWQYDYGQTLRIQGLNLPSAVEIHFSLQESGGTSVSRVGVTKDGITDVIIPDSMLENDGATRNYDMFAFVYLTDDTSGQTEYKIKLQVKSRPKPEVPGGGEDPNIFHEAVQAVQKSADKAAESEKQAEGWAHGREDLPERAQDNAGQIQTERVEGAGNTAVESVKTAQGKATQAVETAKTEAVKAVQTEGTTQTGNVSEEGGKQVQAVRQAAQEIVADREQIAQNKAGIEALKQGKADAIVETASGEIIQAEDSSGLGFQGLRIFGKSTQDGVPSPESPVPIASAGDKGTIEVKITGKNLYKTYGISCFNIPNIASNRVIKNKYGTSINTTEPTEKIVVTQSAAPNSSEPCSYENGYFCIGIDNLEINKEYLFLSDVKINNNPLNVRELAIMTNGKSRAKIIIENNRLTGKFTYKENGDSQYLEIRNSGCSIELTNIMIIDTSFANNTSYEPYRIPQSLTLATPNGLPGIKVDSDGNYTDKNGQQWICDEIDLERGKYVQRVGKYIFDGTEITQDTWLPTIVVGMRPDGLTGVVYSTHFLLSNYGSVKFSNNTGRNFGFGGEKWKVSNGKELAAFFKSKYDAGKPVEVQYILASPIEHDLTPEEIATYKSLHTNYPTTVVSNDESAHMEVSYVADTKHYIASKIETPLQKQIIDLQNALISQKISGGGIKVTDSVKVPVIKLSMWGKTEQVRTTGAQLFDVFWLRSKTMNGITFDILQDGGVHVYGTATAQAYMSPVELHLLPGIYFVSSKNTNKKISFFVSTASEDSDNWKEYSEKVVTVLETEKTRAYLNVMGGLTVDEVIYPMLNKGDTPLPWEPYSGGFPSPSPDWEQPIEVTDHPVTVTVKGGTEQQSITLVPPRPLTKWDKLEKIDGVWQWVYKSKTDKLVSFDSKFADEELSGETFCRYQSNINPGFSSKRTEILCTKLRNDKKEDSVFFNTLGAGYIVLYFNKKIGIDTLEKANNWIALNNDISFAFYNAVTPPEYIPLPQPVQDKLNALTMYAGTTEIANDGGCNMESTYTVDTQSYVDTKIAEISKAIL